MDTISFCRDPFNRLHVTFHLIYKTCSLFSFSCITSAPMGCKCDRDSRPAAHFTKLVYLSYGILDRRADVPSFCCKSDILPFPLLPLDYARQFKSPAKPSAAGGRTTAGMPDTQYMIRAIPAPAVGRLKNKERSLCIIMIQIEQIVVISLETITLTNRHLTRADVPEQLETLPEIVTVVVTADRLVPRAPRVPEAAPDRRDPWVIPAPRGP